MTPQSKKFIRISTEYLLAEDRKIDFDIFTMPPNSNKPLLLIAADTHIADIKNILARKNHGPLYITQKASTKFEIFMEGSLDSIIKN
ncbi:MAG: hypothetical protein V1782_06715, partial [Pseudomonadota bacterium]